MPISGANIENITKELKNYHATPNLMRLYLNTNTADVHFHFDYKGIDKSVPAHRCLLAIGSPVFQQMFFGELKEGNDVNIVDASAEGFTEFLQFFYLDKVLFTTENIAEVMTLADKYDVAGCMNLCAQFLECALTTDIVCWCFELALLFNLSHLIDICEERICLESKMVFESNTFKHCSRLVLQKILSMGQLSCDEVVVFKAAMNWATEVCKQTNLDADSPENRRKQLGDCFDLIRFPTMSSEEFTKCLDNQDGLFNASEMLDILSHLTMKRPLKIATKFSQTPRQGTPAWVKDNTICICDRRSLPNLCEDVRHDRDVVSFSVNERILLGQLSISTYKTASSVDPSSLEFKHGTLCIRKKNAVTKSDGWEDAPQLLLTQTITISNQRFSKLVLTKPIVVQPFADYEIETTWELVDDEMLVFRTECRNEVMLDGGIRFRFNHHLDLPYDNVNKGLIAKFYFKRW